MNINATPANVILAGKTYLIFPLTENDDLALDEFVQGCYLRVANASKDDRVILLALNEAINLRWNYSPGSKILIRHGGWGRVIFQALHLPLGTEYFNPCKDATEQEMVDMIATYRRINDIVKSDKVNENPIQASIDTNKG